MALCSAWTVCWFGHTKKLHVSAEVPGSAHAARNCAYVEMGKVSAGAGSRQGQQGESQRVFVQPRCLFKGRDLICRQQGGEMRIRQNRGRGLIANSLQAERKQLENVDA